jgi:hypothetical protein
MKSLYALVYKLINLLTVVKFLQHQEVLRYKFITYIAIQLTCSSAASIASLR